MDYEQTLDAEINEDQIIVSPIMKESLRVAALWARFLAIIGFIVAGIIVLVAVFAASFLSAFPEINEFSNLAIIHPAVITFSYILMGALIFFPNLFLLQFAIKTLGAIKQISQAEMEAAIIALKRYFLFWGAVTLIVVILNALGIILGLADLAA